MNPNRQKKKRKKKTITTTTHTMWKKYIKKANNTSDLVLPLLFNESEGTTNLIRKKNSYLVVTMWIYLSHAYEGRESKKLCYIRKIDI